MDSGGARYTRDRDAYVANFQRRATQDALASASVWYWRRRAAEFAAVGTPDCQRIALACSEKAAVIERHGLDQDQLLADLWAVAVFGLDVTGVA